MRGVKLGIMAAAGMAASALWGNAASAQTPPVALPPQPLSWFGDPGSPDLSGVWTRVDAPAGVASREGWTPWPPPLRGAFAAMWKKRVADARAGTRDDDPVTACLPAGMPRFITGMDGPLLIVQTPGRVAMSREYGPLRRIWLDRSPPAADNLEQFYQGNSVGHYEGTVLVVETVGLKDEPIDATGVPHSDQVMIEERYQRMNAQTLTVQVTVKDRLALSRPMGTTVTYTAVTDPHWEIRDLTCVPKTGYHPELFVK